MSYGVSGSNVYNKTYEESNLDFSKYMTKLKKLKIF